MIPSAVGVAPVQVETLVVSDQGVESVASERLGQHALSELLVRMARLRLPRLLEAIRRLSHVVSDGSVQIARSVQRDGSEIAGIGISAATARSGNVQSDLNASVASEPSVLNVNASTEHSASVDSDGVTVARAQADNDSMTDESARVASEGLATHTDLRVKVGAHARNLTVMSVVVGPVAVRTIVVTVVLIVVTTGSVDALASSVVESPVTVADSRGIGLSPLRGQT